MRADLVVIGRIATLAGSPEDGFGWVEAIAIGGGHVLAAGSRADVDAALDGSPRALRLPPDRVAVPGLTDAHIHLADCSLAARRIDLTGAPNLQTGLSIVRSFAATQPGEGGWLEGDGWDPGRWGNWPTADDLEHAAPGRRIVLWSHDHHAVWASAAALAVAGIDARTPDPDGGLIRRDAAGRPTGILHEAATVLVLRHLPQPRADELEQAIRRVAADVVSLGIVAVHDPGEVAADATLSRGIAAYAALDERGALPVRVHVSVRRESLAVALERGLRSGTSLAAHGPRSRARVGWIKLFADGALGSRTARLLAPYERDPGLGEPPGGRTGVWVTDPEELGEVVRAAAEAGIAGEVHAIGDAAVRHALDVLAPTAGLTPLMPRIEHIQLVDPADIGRFGRSGVGASVQPVHIRSDAEPARRLWGHERVEAGGYPYGSLAGSGAVLAFGSDAPVESYDPWPAIATAVVRRDPGWPVGDEAFVPAERLSLARALRAACVDPALLAGEADRGRLVPGQRADLVVIPAEALDAPAVPGGALDGVRPDLVLVDGATAFEA